MYSVLNTLSKYTYFYISNKLLHTLLLLVFKIVESLQCNLKGNTHMRSFRDYRKRSGYQRNDYETPLGALSVSLLKELRNCKEKLYLCLPQSLAETQPAL